MFNLFKRPRILELPERITVRRALSDETPLRHTRTKEPAKDTGEAPVTGNLFTTRLDGQDFVWMGTNRAELSVCRIISRAA